MQLVELSLANAHTNQSAVWVILDRSRAVLMRRTCSRRVLVRFVSRLRPLFLLFFIFLTQYFIFFPSVGQCWKFRNGAKNKRHRAWLFLHEALPIDDLHYDIRLLERQ